MNLVMVGTAQHIRRPDSRPAWYVVGCGWGGAKDSRVWNVGDDMGADVLPRTASTRAWPAEHGNGEKELNMHKTPVS